MMLEAEFTIRCNDRMHILIEEVKEEKGVIDDQEVYRRYEVWMKREVNMRRMKKLNLKTE